MKRNIIILSCFAIFCAIVVFPPIAYHYIYPNINDDTATLFSVLITKNPTNFPYAGMIYVGYPVLWLAKLIHANSFNVWMWFNLLVLIPCGVALYFIGTKLFNWKIGLMMMFVPIFVSGGILEYQYMGIIFSLIEVVMLIPLFLYCVVKYLTDKKVYQLIIVIVLAILASTFHTSGLYIPLIIGVALVSYIIYKAIRHELKDTKYYLKVSLFAIGIVALSIVGIALMSDKTLQFVNQLSNSLFNGQSIVTRQYSMQFGLWFSFVSIPIVIIALSSIILIIKNKVKINNQVKMFIYFMACWLFVLLVLGFGRISTDPIRAELDASVVIGLIATILLGVVITQVKDKTMIYVLIFVIAIGMLAQFNLWFRNNSAIKESDKQAIAYLNTLNNVNYNCTSNVPYWIYDQLVTMKYSSTDTDLIITRNKPMTPRSDKTVPEYIPHDYSITSQNVLVKSFINNGIEVDIYDK